MSEKKLDETVVGGRYIQNGVVVNSEGEPIKGLTVKNGEIVEAKAGKKDEE